MSTLHITNGDCVAEPLRTVVPGQVLLACDALHEGPAPAGIEGPAWRELRSGFLAKTAAADTRWVLHQMTELDAALARAGQGDEVVLWFEHDLFDQLNLIRTLTVLAAAPAAPSGTVAAGSLICVGQFLGRLSAAELASLYPSRRAVTASDYELARQAWQAFRAADPSELIALVVRLQRAGGGEARGAPPEPALPFLGRALERFLAEYPSTTNGLSRTEDAALRALEPGALPGRELFANSQAVEEAVFLGDLTFFDLLLNLAAAGQPLVEIDGARTAQEVGTARVSLTRAGHEVLAGRADAVRLNGIDRWRGGVHLSGREAAWRWDPVQENLVSWS